MMAGKNNYCPICMKPYDYHNKEQDNKCQEIEAFRQSEYENSIEAYINR